jgi:hypothetical protein
MDLAVSQKADMSMHAEIGAGEERISTNRSGEWPGETRQWQIEELAEWTVLLVFYLK